MRLPNGDEAVVDIAKIREYCLSVTHPRGKHKARVFQSVFGMTAADAEALRSALSQAARNADAEIGDTDLYGTRYIIDFDLERNARVGRIRSCWILLTGELAPRFVTCFVL